MKRMNTAATPWAQQPQPGTLPPGAEAEIAQPARPANLASDVLVPLVQALVTGALLGGLVVFTLGEIVPDLDVDPLKAWAGLALAISTVAWLLLLGQTRRLLWALEKVTRLDLDGDRQVGQPSPVVRVEVTNGQREMYLDLPGRPEALATMALGVLNGRSLAEGTWSGRGGLFSRSEFRQIRDILIERGLAVWRNPEAKAQGVELTAAGRAVFRRLAELSE